MPQVEEPSAPPAYYVQAFDAKNNLLTRVQVYSGAIVDGTPGEQVFTATFPAPAGKVARLELLKGSLLLDTLNPGQSTPVVSIVSPTAGETIGDEMMLSWQSIDPDPGDNLLHTVLYSPDNGATWQAQITDLPGTPGSDTVALSLKDLRIPGSSEKTALIRVVSSDGYNTGFATSELFTVANRKPKVAILSPRDGETTQANEPLRLRGTALDPEDGSLKDKALTWTVDGRSSGLGQELMIWGLTPGDHRIKLTARDWKGQEAVAEVTVAIAPLTVPATSAPVMDGFCDEAAYQNGVEVMLRPYGDHSQASVRLVRRSESLWACFTGLHKAASPDESVMVLVDANHSRDDIAQANDFRFILGEDGGFVAQLGNGGGGFNSPGPDGFEARVSATDNNWRAELRIDTTDYGNLIGLALNHLWAGETIQNEQKWPAGFVENSPASWATAALAPVPRLVTLSPNLAIVGSGDLTLSVVGAGFVNGATVMWNDISLPTTYENPTQLTVSVKGALLSGAGEVKVTVRNPVMENVRSNSLSFVVSNPTPKISSLSPAKTMAGGATFWVTSLGAVLWRAPPCCGMVTHAQLSLPVHLS